MRTLISRLIILAFAGLVLLPPSFASAQAPRRRSRGRKYQSSVTSEPYVSPYMNLILPTGDPGYNYMNFVQPQIQQQRYNQQQSAQTRSLDREIQQQEQMTGPYGPIGGIRPTGGNAATFGNYSHYYPSKSGVSSSPRQYKVRGLGGAGGGMGMGMGMGMGGGF